MTQYCTMRFKNNKYLFYCDSINISIVPIDSFQNQKFRSSINSNLTNLFPKQTKIFMFNGSIHSTDIFQLDKRADKSL